jgi:hypothetical protein
MGEGQRQRGSESDAEEGQADERSGEGEAEGYYESEMGEGQGCGQEGVVGEKSGSHCRKLPLAQRCTLQT